MDSFLANSFVSVLMHASFVPFVVVPYIITFSRILVNEMIRSAFERYGQVVCIMDLKISAATYHDARIQLRLEIWQGWLRETADVMHTAATSVPATSVSVCSVPSGYTRVGDLPICLCCSFWLHPRW